MPIYKLNLNCILKRVVLKSYRPRLRRDSPKRFLMLGQSWRRRVMGRKLFSISWFIINLEAIFIRYFFIFFTSNVFVWRNFIGAVVGMFFFFLILWVWSMRGVGSPPSFFLSFFFLSIFPRVIKKKVRRSESIVVFFLCNKH